MKLHEYQQRCLDELQNFFVKIKEWKSPQKAFVDILARTYYPPPGLSENTPYICIRVPTGGGKTLMAAHTAVVAAKEYLESETPVCLWLAPSDAIVKQTLKSLQNRRHPCHLALTLGKAFNEVNCISLATAMRTSKADMESAATIIVATIQSLRVEATKGRKVYEDNGHIMTHFEGLSEKLRGKLERGQDGEIVYSLANALQLRRPIVISDESHNAATSLSFETLGRFNPSCIIEFSATPQLQNTPQKKIYASNVLCQASVRELKETGMIKFPLHLEVAQNWRESIRAAIAKREELEKAAKPLKEEYIRPIVLYQAESKSGEATVEVVREVLVNEFEVPQEQIAVHTGSTRDIAQIDLFSRDCPVRHIITVQALAEGWDCSFAYVLCTMANWSVPRPVEQVLGRIMRLPGATKKSVQSLNECYAFAAKASFNDIARNLTNTLVKKSGFQRIEADDFIMSRENESGSLFGNTSGVVDHIKPACIRPLSVPFLMVCESGKLEFLEAVHFLGAKWSIANEKPNMENFLFPQTAVGKGKADVNKSEKVVWKIISVDEMCEQLMLLEVDKKWTVVSLAAWLDAKIEHPDIPQIQSSPYMLAAVKQLLKKHDKEISELARWRFDIKKYIAASIDKLRRQQAAKGWQQMLKGMKVDGGKLVISAAHALTFERRRYAAHWHCQTQFKKHLFLNEVGELKDSGEEWECARFLDNLPAVEVWVRNLERRENSFWLQTSTDKFYPDFVCRLKDKRILVVEYKGEDRWSNDDSKEKRAIGEIWAKLSGGKCLFVMPQGKDWKAIGDCIKPTEKDKKHTSHSGMTKL